MRTLTIGLMDSASAMRDMRESAIRAWETAGYQGESITYETPVQLFKVFTLKRWEMITCLQQREKPVGIRELAQQLGRDEQSTQDDIKVLLEEGVVEQDNTGISIPFAEIHTDFTLKKAA